MTDLTAMTRFVKICGITSLQDAQSVVDAGATALGIIVTTSPRQVSLEKATEISRFVANQLVRVGVFRNDDDDFIVRAAEAAGFDAVQIHGPLSDQLRENLSARDVTVIKALAIGSSEFVNFDDSLVGAVLIDGPSPGSGATHSWSAVTTRTWTRPLIAAGGLTPQTVEDVLTLTNAWGCDVATGVESAPGVKSATKVQEFVAAAQRHFDQREELRD